MTERLHSLTHPLQYSWASFVTQLVKNPPAMWETWVWSLGWEDILEKGKATQSDILAWTIPWAALSMGLQWIGHNWATFPFIAFFCNMYFSVFNILFYNYWIFVHIYICIYIYASIILPSSFLHSFTLLSLFLSGSSRVINIHIKTFTV